MLMLHLRAADDPDAEEIVITLPDGREATVRRLDGRTIGIDAPKDVRVSRRKLREKEGVSGG